MRVLKIVEVHGHQFLQAHINEPPSKIFLRDATADLLEAPENVKCLAHVNNLGLQKMIVRRGFVFLTQIGHLKIYVRPRKGIK